MPTAKQKVHVHVVSDATGITAERVISAVLVQFEKDVEPVLERFSFVKTPAHLKRILDSAQKTDAVVIYSLVSEKMRATMNRERRKRELTVIDLMGPLLRRMEKLLNVIPSLHPGLLGMLGEESIRLAECIDFTLRHDDGQNLETLGRADVIIMGVSRTGKTPSSLYLACNFHLRVANVPIVLGLEPPKKMFSLKRPKKFGFIIDPGKLALIRTRRFKRQAMEGYNDPASVARELNYCKRVFARVPGLRVINVTNSPIEEVANQMV